MKDVGLGDLQVVVFFHAAVILYSYWGCGSCESSGTKEFPNEANNEKNSAYYNEDQFWTNTFPNWEELHSLSFSGRILDDFLVTKAWINNLVIIVKSTLYLSSEFG